MRYEPALDLDALTAIDMHVHVEVDADGRFALPQHLMDASAHHFGAEHRAPTLESIADLYRSLGMAAVVFTVDAQTQLGHAPVSSAWIAETAAHHNDVLIPFGSVDPLRGRAAIEQARMLVEQHVALRKIHHPKSDRRLTALTNDARNGCLITRSSGPR